MLTASGCATPSVTKETGRKMDPPLDVILYCLLSPTDRMCRALAK
ncbi:MAG: hypothetical protein ABI905_04925 [Betaproteobacteria bacterium]